VEEVTNLNGTRVAATSQNQRSQQRSLDSVRLVVADTETSVTVESSDSHTGDYLGQLFAHSYF
jgi:hypothetical protein